MSNFLEWLTATSLSQLISSVEWIIPLVQSIHIVAICVCVGSVFLALAPIGQWIRTDVSVAGAIRRYSPWFWAAIGTLLLTGLVLVVAEPQRQFLSISFWVKMSLVAVEIGMAAVFQRIATRNSTCFSNSAVKPSVRSKLAATLAIVGFGVIIFLGRMIAYDAILWGSLSPQHHS